MFKIRNPFKKQEVKPVFDIQKFETRWPVGSWYTSGSHQVVRLSNVYIKDGNPCITIEYPKLKSSPIESVFIIQKDDDLSPSYLNGWTKVAESEQNKLEKSYWKSIENQLKNETQSNKTAYINFIKSGNKK